MSGAAPLRRKERNAGPIKAGDVVQVERVDGDDAMGLVKGEDEFHTSRNRLIVELKGDGLVVNTERSRCSKVTGAQADLVRKILGGDE